MGSCEVREGRHIVARLPHGGDLFAEILAVAQEHDVTLGHLWAIGAVQRARIAFYDQQQHVYRELELDEHLEIVSLIGNLSRRDGQTALHAHAAFADGLGGTCGGHLVPGCVIFAGELYLTELTGQELERSHDQVTGLPLWRDL